MRVLIWEFAINYFLWYYNGQMWGYFAMGTRIDELKWKLFKKKRFALLLYGLKTGLVHLYDEELLSRLREVSYGGLSASLLLLNAGLTNGYCYDRGPLITLGFGDDDFQLVDADIDSIKLNPQYIKEYREGKLGDDYANHCFAERTDANGVVWVYDASDGLVVEKNLYYMMERPRITKVNGKAATLAYLDYDFLRDADFERDKYVLPIVLPIIEDKLVPINPCYQAQLKRELELLKERAHYDDLCREMQEDMKAKGFN